MLIARSLTKLLIHSVVLVATMACFLNAQQESRPNGVSVALAVLAKRPPRLDGTLNDVIWTTAAAVADFRQREPLETQPATEKTEVHILYDSHHIYFGVHCYDHDPGSIVATQLRQDLSQDLDDNFAVLIDPTLSHRNGFIFQVNPLGTQRDGEVIEEHLPPPGDSIVDASWDGVWISAAQITTDGWTATIAIPFGTLNFPGGSDVTWGINFRRFIRRKNEEDAWSGYRRVFGFWRVSQEGVLLGLREIKSSRLLVVKPYGLVGARSFSNAPWSALHTGGVDVKYGLGRDLVALGTVNTDFSDADVDQQEFNLTPYPILIPEKRRFFLEDADIFNFPLWSQDLLFFTRQIGIDPVSGQEVPIDAGGKIAGQAGGFDLGVMNVRTRAEGSNPYANYAVARVKHPLMPGSYIGFIATDKESGNPLDPYNRSAGLDAKFLLFRNLSLRGYYVKSWSPSLSGDNAAFGGRLGYANNWFNIYAGHGVTEKNFNPEMGFVTRTDDQPTTFQFFLTPRPHGLGIREIDVGALVSHDPDTAGKLIYREWTPSISVLFNNSAEIDSAPEDVTYQFLAQPLHLYRNVSIPAGGYRFTSHQIAFTSTGNRRLTYNGSFLAGSYYTGTLKTATLNAQYRPSPHLALTLSDTLNVFRLPQGNFNIELLGLQISYAFNRSVNLTSFLQADTAQTQTASANVRLRYTFRPDSDLYVIYNLGTRFQSLAAGNPMPVREEKFAVKITYSWSR
jgi:hypothetical protein